MNRPNNIYWSRERVKNGLLRFVRDYYAADPKNLPWNYHAYRIAVPDDQMKIVRQLRLYPPYQIVARHYESMIAAWRDLGYEVAERGLQYWTRDEVIAGLKRFYADFGCCPVYAEYTEKISFSPKHDKRGNLSPTGAYGKYPGFLSIRKFFGSMREAWTAAGFEVNKHWEEWTPLEDWFAVESCGILPRAEVAEILKRTVPAVKRRLYDLGRITANTRWGMSISRAEKLLEVSSATLRKYINHGALPVFRGNKVIYVNPADLLVIEEFDWRRSDINAELEREVRRALIHRLTKILTFRENRRDHEIYKAETPTVYRGRIKNRRVSALTKGTPPAPNSIKAGDWVKVVERHKQIAENRIGIVKSIGYSQQKVRRKDGTRRACWTAIVEFPKLKRLNGAEARRIRYGIPLDLLIESAEPEIEKTPLKQTPEAIRGRKRFAEHLMRAGKRFEEIKPALS